MMPEYKCCFNCRYCLAPLNKEPCLKCFIDGLHHGTHDAWEPEEEG